MRVLLVLTGPSHAGKTTVARELLTRLPPDAAYVSIDETVMATGSVGLDEWEGRLPAAYRAAAAQVRDALCAGSTVVYESTFTFVPPDGRPAELHTAELERLVEVADECDAALVVARVTASLPELMRRRARTARLTDAVVEGTWRQHEAARLSPAPSLELSTDDLGAVEAAERILAALRRRQVPGATT